LPCLPYGPSACSVEGAFRRRLVGGAGVAPAPLCTHTGGPGRLGSPSALKMKGCLQWLDAVRMKGRRKPSRISAGFTLPCPGPEERSRGGRRHSGAPEGGVPRKARGTFYEVPDYEVAPFRRSAPQGADAPGLCSGPETRGSGVRASMARSRERMSGNHKGETKCLKRCNQALSS
jgi:hypothetical protein